VLFLPGCKKEKHTVKCLLVSEAFMYLLCFRLKLVLFNKLSVCSLFLEGLNISVQQIVSEVQIIKAKRTLSSFFNVVYASSKKRNDFSSSPLLLPSLRLCFAAINALKSILTTEETLPLHNIELILFYFCFFQHINAEAVVVTLT